MKSSKTNPVGTGTENFHVNAPTSMKRATEELAERLGISCGELVRSWIADGLRRADEAGEIVVRQRLDAAADDLQKAALEYARAVVAPSLEISPQKTKRNPA